MSSVDYLKQKTITIEEAEPGMVLAFGVYSNDGALLLSGGSRLSSREQIASLKLANASLITISVHGNEYQPKRAEHHELASDLDEETETPRPLQLEQARQLLNEIKSKLKSILRPIAKGTAGRASPDAIVKIAGRIGAFARQNSMVVAARLAVAWNAEDLVFSHTANVAGLCASIARSMGLDSKRTVALCSAALLHDVGMIPALSSVDLSSGRLNEREMNALRKHPDASRRIVKNIADVPVQVRKAVFQHHERLDGSGYPTGAVRDQICDFARVLGLADHFCNLLTGWPDRDPLPAHLAIPHISKTCDMLFGTELLQHTVKVVGVYPVGTIVKLSSGELAVVSSVNHDDLLRPEVAVIFGPERVFSTRPERCLDLAAQSVEAEQTTIMATADLKDFGIDYFEWLSQPSN